MNGNSFNIHKNVIVELLLPSEYFIKSSQTQTRYEVGDICGLREEHPSTAIPFTQDFL